MDFIIIRLEVGDICIMIIWIYVKLQLLAKWSMKQDPNNIQAWAMVVHNVYAPEVLGQVLLQHETV